jgi:RHS repeat-associated protein
MNKRFCFIRLFPIALLLLAQSVNAQSVINISGLTGVCVGETKTYYAYGYSSVTWSVTGGGVIIGSNTGPSVNVQWNSNGILNADYCYWIDPPENCYPGQVPCDPDQQPPCYGTICEDPPPYQVCDHGDLSVTTNAYPPVPPVTGGLSKAIPGATILTASNGSSFQWLRNGVAIPGATSTQYMAVASGVYKVRSTNLTTGCATESTGTTVNGNDKNFSVSNSILIPGVTTEAQLHVQQLNDGANLGYVNQSVSYADDIGRPIESVQVQSSPARKDMIGFKDFDAIGREAKKWLPYTSGQATGMFVAVSTAISSQSTFFTALNDKIVDDTSPFATTAFENSPLSRGIGQKGAGNFWQSNNIGTAASYGSNSASAVLNWSVDATSGLPIAFSPFYYTSSALSKSVGTDEQNINSEAYADLQGRKILSRTDAGGGVWAETYHIYDAKNNLKFMLPPQLVKLLKDANSFTPTQSQIDAWAYQYKYDNLGRQIESKRPGTDWSYTIYDNRDRVVLSQDGKQRLNNEWSYTKYDEFNRPLISGIYRPGSAITRAAMQSTVDSLSIGLGYQNLNPQARVMSGVKVGIDIIVSAYENINEYKALNSVTLKAGFTFTAGTTASAFQAGIDDGSVIATSADVFPTTNDEALVISYYDTYKDCGICQDAKYQFFNEAWGVASNEPFQKFTRIKGSTVAGSVKVLGSTSGQWLNSVTYYNRQGQAIQTISSNHVNGIERHSTLPDFSGKTLRALTTYTGMSVPVSTILRRFDYDHAGRVMKTYHQINSQPEVVLSANEYNELGQVVDKSIHSVAGSAYLQSIDYRYNIRGAALQMNSTAGDAGDPNPDYFRMELGYNNTFGALNMARHDGAISGIKWKQDLSTKERGYGFNYNNQGWLTAANYKLNNSDNWLSQNGNYSEDGLSYDFNWNIKTLNRKQMTSAVSAPVIDQLTYDYGTGGNKLFGVIDSAPAGDNKDKGFKDVNTVGDDYVYDINGNLIQDKNKNFTVTYNFLNLSDRITFTDNSYLQYTYDAGGTKLRQAYYNASNQLVSKTDYLGELMLLNDQLQMIHHEEGRIIPADYTNLIPNPTREGGSLEGYNVNYSTPALTVTTVGSQTYVKAVSTVVSGGGFGIFPIGTTFNVKPGESYQFTVLGYQSASVGATASLFVVDNNNNSIVWPGAALPIGLTNEGIVTSSFTVPPGTTQIRLGVFWYGNTATTDEFYINRVALYKTDFEYQYFLTDQVGSPRVVLQTNAITTTHAATMESENFNNENPKWLNLNSSRFTIPPSVLLANATPGGDQSIMMDKDYRVGPAKSFKVFPGDQINGNVQAYYTTGGFSQAATTSAIITAVQAVLSGGSSVIDGAIQTAYTTTGNSAIALGGYAGAAQPSAYLNYILFDENYVPLKAKSFPVQNNVGVRHTVAFDQTLQVDQLGYLFVYLSYDNENTIPVYFDELKITYTESPVIQVNNYYPFGLASTEWVREGETDNNFLFQGKELEDKTGLHDFHARQYDAALGRWFATDPAGQYGSPYLGMGNNPVNGTDPSGEWFGIDDLVAAGIGFVVGYVSSGLQSGDWGSKSLIAGGIGAAAGWLAYNTGGLSAATSTSGTAHIGQFAANQALGIAGSFLPSPSFQIGNFSFGLSPAFSTSGLGVNGNIGYSDGDVSLGIGLGLGYSTGTNDLSGKFRTDSRGLYRSLSVNGGGMIEGAYYGASYGVNSSRIGGTRQRVAYYGAQIGDFGIRIDEDYFLGGDGKDRWRTGGGTATYRINKDVTLAAGLGMITGERGGDLETKRMSNRIFGNNRLKSVTDPNLETPHGYRGGAFYGGIIYRGQASFVGINHERILHRVQDWIHDNFSGTEYYFGNAGYKPKAWSYFGNYSMNTLVY